MNIFTKWLLAVRAFTTLTAGCQGVHDAHCRLLGRSRRSLPPVEILFLTADCRPLMASLLTAIFCSVMFVLPARGDQIPIAVSGEPRATLQVGANASEQEQFAATEIQSFIQQFTGANLDIRTNRQQTQTQTVIVLGTPKSNPTIAGLQANVELTLATELGDEGYRIKTVEVGREIVIVVTAHTERGVIYGAYAFIENCITALTGLQPVHPELPVAKAQALLVPFMDETSSPFYPVRAVLEIEDPDWLARHRINMSGGEGVWTGTGIEDGFGTAFKYVDTPLFEALQDEPIGQRRERIATLQNRFNALDQRGIDAYLFMYVTGEPTEALIQQRPDVLGPRVLYGASRNEVSYRPFCWSKPAFHTLARELTQTIVRTYPALAGFHLRSWGYEPGHVIVLIVAIDRNRDKQNFGKSTLRLSTPHGRCGRTSNFISPDMIAVGSRMPQAFMPDNYRKERFSRGNGVPMANPSSAQACRSHKFGHSEKSGTAL